MPETNAPTELEIRFGQIVMALLQNQFDEARELALPVRVRVDVVSGSPFVRAVSDAETELRNVAREVAADLHTAATAFRESIVSKEFARTADSMDKSANELEAALASPPKEQG